MALISSSIPNLINGVSQQPDEVRQPSQAEEQLNGFSSVVKGLVKRPPFERLGSVGLQDIISHPDSFHIYERDETEKYVVSVRDKEILVHDFTGQALTVTSSDPSEATQYLTAKDPKSLEFKTIADHTFVLNTERKVRLKAIEGNAPTVVSHQEEGVTIFKVLPLGEKKTAYRKKVGEDYTTETISPYYSFGIRPFLSQSNFHYVTMGAANRSGADDYRPEVNEVKPWLVDLDPTEELPTPFEYAAFLGAEIERTIGLETVVEGDIIRIYGSWDVDSCIRDQSAEIEYSHLHTFPDGETVERYREVIAIPSHVPQQEGYSEEGSPYFEKLLSNVIRLVDFDVDEEDIVTNVLDDVQKEAVVFIKAGNYGATYSIYVNGSQVASTTRGTTAVSQIQTHSIASSLASAASSSLGAANWTINNHGNRVHIKRKADADGSFPDFDIRAEDSTGNNSSIAFKGTITDYLDLPAVCTDGYNVKIEGDAGSGEDDWYVTFDGTDNVWRESTQAGLNYELDPRSMPHKLVREADGTFTFSPIDWGSRSAGDTNTAPDPSFVNQTINDIFFFKERLGLLTGESIVLSEVGQYYNFYPTTVRSSLDTKPLDVSVLDERIADLKHAVVFDESLLVFSKYAQFALDSQGTFTAKSVKSNVTTRFESSTIASPVGAGKNVFFPTYEGGWSGMLEYFVDSEYRTKDAANITAHCPLYIEGEITQIIGSSNEDIIICRTDSTPDKLYVYSYFWKGTDKVQSSWSTWQTSGSICDMTFLNNEVVLIVLREGQYYIEVLKLGGVGDPTLNGFPTEILLDSRSLIRQEPSAGSLVDPLDDVVGVGKDGSVYYGEADIIESIKKQDTYIGTPYEFSYAFSKQQVKREGSTTPLRDGRLQLRSFAISFADTGAFEVEVTPKGRTPSTYPYRGRVLGTDGNRVGRTQLESGVFRAPILSNALTVDIKLKNNSPTPNAFQSVEWEGVYNTRAKRI
jgi:hypothetical protein